MRPLQGRRIAITRQVEDSQGLAQALQELGAEVHFFPAIRRVDPTSFEALDEGISGVKEGSYHGLLFTSPAAVDAFGRRCGEMSRILRASSGGGGTLVSHFPSDLIVAAVGPGTAKAAAALGLVPAVVPERHDGVALAGAVGAHVGEGIRGMRFLQPRAEEGRGELSLGLRQLGAEVRVVPAYKTLAVSPSELRPLRDALLRGELDALIFASPSAVHAVFGALRDEDDRGSGEGRRERPWLGEAWAIAIGETTAASLRERGAERISVALEATDVGLIAATLQAWSEPGS